MRIISNILEVLVSIIALAMMVVLGYVDITSGYEVWSEGGDPSGLVGILAGILLIVLALGVVASTI